MANRNREGLGPSYKHLLVEPHQYTVYDGDTLLFKEGFTIAGRDRLHLHGIDAPELDQTLTVTEDLSRFPYLTIAHRRRAVPAVGDEVPIGVWAKEGLEALLDRQPIELYNLFWDRFYSAEHNTGSLYGDVQAWSRYFGRHNRTRVNLSMVGAGLAMVHTYYATDHLIYEQEARQRNSREDNTRRGFWMFLAADEEDFSPARYRQGAQHPDDHDPIEEPVTLDGPESAATLRFVRRVHSDEEQDQDEAIDRVMDSRYALAEAHNRARGEIPHTPPDCP